MLQLLEPEQVEEELQQQHSIWKALADAFLQLYGRRKWSPKCHLFFEHIGKIDTMVELIY
jgi:hypothetical protein